MVFVVCLVKLWCGSHESDGNPVPGETEDMFGILGELPDLWDININDYSLEMGLSRFVQEGALEPYVSSIKTMTTKPVVSVGRFTSPDTMASQIRRGVLDFIGSARPSIADPFLGHFVLLLQTSSRWFQLLSR